MKLIIKDINLADDATDIGGTAFFGEKLSDLLDEHLENNTRSLADINRYLVKCGIEPIKLEQIVIVGKIGE